MLASKRNLFISLMVDRPKSTFTGGKIRDMLNTSNEKSEHLSDESVQVATTTTTTATTTTPSPTTNPINKRKMKGTISTILSKTQVNNNNNNNENQIQEHDFSLDSNNPVDENNDNNNEEDYQPGGSTFNSPSDLSSFRYPVRNSPNKYNHRLAATTRPESSSSSSHKRLKIADMISNQTVDDGNKLEKKPRINVNSVPPCVLVTKSQVETPRASKIADLIAERDSPSHSPTSQTSDQGNTSTNKTTATSASCSKKVSGPNFSSTVQSETSPSSSSSSSSSSTPADAIPNLTASILKAHKITNQTINKLTKKERILLPKGPIVDRTEPNKLQVPKKRSNSSKRHKISDMIPASVVGGNTYVSRPVRKEKKNKTSDDDENEQTDGDRVASERRRVGAPKRPKICEMMSKRTTSSITTPTESTTTTTSLDHKVSTDKISSLIRNQSGIPDQLGEHASNSDAHNHRNTKKIIDILSKTQQTRNGETTLGSGSGSATATTTTKVPNIESGWTKTPICQIMKENEKLNGHSESIQGPRTKTMFINEYLQTIAAQSDTLNSSQKRSNRMLISDILNHKPGVLLPFPTMSSSSSASVPYPFSAEVGMMFSSLATTMQATSTMPTTTTNTTTTNTTSMSTMSASVESQFQIKNEPICPDDEGRDGGDDVERVPFIKSEPVVVDENLELVASDARGAICVQCQRCYIGCFDQPQISGQDLDSSSRPLGNKLNKMGSYAAQSLQDDQDYMNGLCPDCTSSAKRNKP